MVDSIVIDQDCARTLLGEAAAPESSSPDSPREAVGASASAVSAYSRPLLRV